MGSRRYLQIIIQRESVRKEKEDFTQMDADKIRVNLREKKRLFHADEFFVKKLFHKTNS